MYNFIKNNPFIAHVLFWVGLLFLDALEGEGRHEFYHNLTFGTCNIIAQMIAAYLTGYYLIPKLFAQNKYLQFTIWFVISAYLISVLARILVVHVGEPLVRVPPFEQETFLEIFMDIEYLAFNYFPSVYIVVAFFLLIIFLDFSNKNLSLQKEKTSAELKVLKSQLNPHFLFNTLNNIYSLSLDNSPKTSESIGKLSEILDYILYRCEPKFVPLSSEIELLENYISLEKLRYDDRLKITFKKEINISMEIAPLILLSLVENAFKHGAGEDGGSPGINISLHSEPSGFTFMISNTVVDSGLEKSGSAIGLKNIKKQLDLIYPNQYQLNINEQANLFTVTLKLQP